MIHDDKSVAAIILSTLNARYAHSSLALRYLYANLGALRAEAAIREFVIQDRPIDIVEKLLADQPRIVGLGVYIWNASSTLEVVRLLRRVAPDVTVVLGGPEVSHETESQELFAEAHYVVCGEGDTAFAALCQQIFADTPPAQKLLRGGLPDLATLPSPYAYYSDEDVHNRVIYVEASRGCPFTCEFCLSSLDEQVRAFPLEPFLADLTTLYDRGVRQFRFIDRTFNLKVTVARRILEFFLERKGPDLFVHFEMVPDRMPTELRELAAAFPPGCLQFEVGIQTFDGPTSTRIRRKQNIEKTVDNMTFLRRETGVHVHADLIVGLPGEDLETFARGFDRLVALAPQEIQVGILKRLRGTPIARHDVEWGMVYSPTPPYEILSSKVLTFSVLQRMKRFARAWDLVANSGTFIITLQLLLSGPSAFDAFLAFTDWLAGEIGSFTGIAQARLCRLINDYLVEGRGLPAETVHYALSSDFARLGRTLPDLGMSKQPGKSVRTGVPSRQARHLA